MRILATLPMLTTTPAGGGLVSGRDTRETQGSSFEQGPPTEVCPAPAPPPAAAGRRGMRRDQRRPFPLRSIAALAALALVAWSLAHWNDARRFHQQEAARLADRPPSAAAEEALLR
jgi:hypothetical protein